MIRKIITKLKLGSCKTKLIESVKASKESEKKKSDKEAT
jgi:hypothetical protein